ncbi:MAG: L,D-transpeptidase [Halocynthiibacter sp.]
MPPHEGFEMLNRRRFVASGITAATVGLLSGTAARAALGDHPLDFEIPIYNLPESQLPRVVELKEGFEPYEVHVDPDHFYLYWTLPNNTAMRYTVGIGMGSLYHPGDYYVARKVEWPRWTPTPDMLIRQPELYLPVKDGMPGGIDNPLGARALYLYTEEKGDSYLRIHGTNDPATIGGAVTNGCARLVNNQIIDVYDRVPIGTRVLLNPKTGAGPAHS